VAAGTGTEIAVGDAAASAGEALSVTVTVATISGWTVQK
tara:strand:- start:338 stop:454 length:117 start_codon:yes stop_codon:yes gene_type:complete